MKHVIMLDNGTRIEIEGNEVKHIDVNGSVLYNTAEFPYVKDKDVPELPYFFLMGKAEREKVVEWMQQLDSKVDNKKLRQREFLDRVKKALEVIDYDYCIATIEPSFDEEENIFYEEGNLVARGISLNEWKIRATNFYSDEKWRSKLAMLEEGDLFKAYRIAMNYWTIEYVCDDSSADGNYWNSPDSAHKFKDSGARKVGGFKDGVGNTYEIYQTESAFALVGGKYCIDGNYCPVADACYDVNPNLIISNGSGVLVLKRSTAH